MGPPVRQTHRTQAFSANSMGSWACPGCRGRALQKASFLRPAFLSLCRCPGIGEDGQVRPTVTLRVFLEPGIRERVLLCDMGPLLSVAQLVRAASGTAGLVGCSVYHLHPCWALILLGSAGLGWVGVEVAGWSRHYNMLMTQP